MQVVILRHGLAIDRDDPVCPPDPERKLTRKGVRQLHRAAAGLKAMDVRPSLIMSSPYVRAIESAQIAGFELRHEGDPIILDELLPDRDPRDFLARLPFGDASSILIVGHAPHLDRLISQVLRVPEGAIMPLEKSGAACLLLSELGEEARGTLQWLSGGRMLRRVRRRD